MTALFLNRTDRRQLMALCEVAPPDPVRPALREVAFEGQYAYATDSFCMTRLPLGQDCTGRHAVPAKLLHHVLSLDDRQHVDMDEFGDTDVVNGRERTTISLDTEVLTVYLEDGEVGIRYTDPYSAPPVGAKNWDRLVGKQDGASQPLPNFNPHKLAAIAAVHDHEWAVNGYWLRWTGGTTPIAVYRVDDEDGVDPVGLIQPIVWHNSDTRGSS